MQISHEVPLCLLQESEKFNDYDYCLLHLVYEFPEYKEYYRNASKKGRKVLLDNSLFELGDSLTLSEVAAGVEALNPTWVVVPDCLNDAEETMRRFEAWMQTYFYLDVETIGVAQGSTVEELEECYRYMSKYADKIAIPFGSTACKILGVEAGCTGDLECRSRGRQLFIDRIVESGLWNTEKPHHLLGCNLASEFSYPKYKELNIESLDTSNPIVAALEGLRYSPTGLDIKPSTKLCDLITHVVTDEERDLMDYNIQVFKNLTI